MEAAASSRPTAVVRRRDVFRAAATSTPLHRQSPRTTPRVDTDDRGVLVRKDLNNPALVDLGFLMGMGEWDMTLSDASLLRTDFGNWYVPTIEALHNLCRAAGFSTVRTVVGPPPPPLKP
jgi:hypothetical protein